MSENDRVKWETREDRESNVGLLDFGNELNHCLEIEDDYLSWQGSDAPEFVNSYGFPQ